MLKNAISRLEDVDESLRGHYKPNESGVGYLLDLDGTPLNMVAKSEHAEAVNRVSEFRNNNIALTKELEELRPLKSQFEGIDPNAARNAILQIQELEKKGVKKPDDVQSQISAALNDFTNKIVEPLKAELHASELARKTAEDEANISLLRTKVGEEFIAMGGKPGALDFILSKAQNVFDIADGTISAKQNKFSMENPGQPIMPKEWLTQQASDTNTNFAFNSSNGGGANPKGSVGSQAQVQKLINPTPSQLGDNMDAIASGKIQVDYTNE